MKYSLIILFLISLAVPVAAGMLVNSQPPIVPGSVSFTALPATINICEDITTSYTVGDGIGLKQVELWQTVDSAGSPDDTAWIQRETTLISGKTSSSTFVNQISKTGSYWYNVRITNVVGGVTTGTAQSLIVSPAITLPYSRNFESDLVDVLLDDDLGGSPATPCLGFDTHFGYANNGYSFTRNYSHEGILPRYGENYWELGVVVDDCGTLEADAHKVYGTLEGFTTGVGCHHMQANDGTEYWIGWSMYVPVGYYPERYPHGIMQIFDSSGIPGPTFILRSFGEDDSSDVSTRGWSANHKFKDFSQVFNLDSTWEDDQGNWVDLVFHWVMYDVQHDNARFVIYKDGVGKNVRPDTWANIRTDCIPYFDFVQYNSAFTYTPATDHVRQCDPSVPGYPFVPFGRALYIDEFKITEGTAGQYGYADVAPPIWAAAPTISYPGNGAVSVPINFTALYSGYVDHRTDAQNVFSYTKTQVQLTDAGGDWVALTYDSSEITGETSHDITNLIASKEYQIRVRHISLRSGTTDKYLGVWSDTHTFTTVN